VERPLHAGHVNVRCVDARLAFAIELEQRDGTAAERLAATALVSGEVERIRLRAGELHALLERLPGERALVDEQIADAARALVRARAGQTEAALAVERARGDDAREAARRVEARAAADVHDAEERSDRLTRRRATLEHDAEQWAAEAIDLERQAATVAARLGESPRVSTTAPPGSGLAELAAWGARAHAAVLVARAGLEAERESIVREANELAASALGEPLYTGNVALVRRALEERLS